jgi:hypothetical protein
MWDVRLLPKQFFILGSPTFTLQEVNLCQKSHLLEQEVQFLQKCSW